MYDRAVARSSWLTSEQACRRLGVKPATLYAYVSRGFIRSERVPGTKRSQFLRTDVERHAARTRTGARAGGLEVIVESTLTRVDPAGTLAYRGWDATVAAREATFESVASWLWTGRADPTPMVASDVDVAAARPVARALATADVVDCWRAAVVAVRSADPLRDDRRPEAVAGVGRRLIGTLLDALPASRADETGSVAARLWPLLTDAAPSARRLRVLDAALILLADHELATSTFGARVAASTWADPYLVVSAGLAVVGGPLHGGAAERARRLLGEVDADGAPEAVGRHLAEGQRLPGFGHAVYEHVDPRFGALVDALGVAGDRPPSLDALVDLAAERQLSFPNVDLALAAVAEAYGWHAEAPQAVFALARITGWLAHAIEEYPHALRYRTRAAYVGEPLRS